MQKFKYIENYHFIIINTHGLRKYEKSLENVIKSASTTIDENNNKNNIDHVSGYGVQAKAN